MRRLSIFLASALLLLHSFAWAHDEKLQAELLDEVLRLTQAEIPDDIILEQIRAWEFAFELTADDIVELRTLGVSDTVLEALIATDTRVELEEQSHVVLTAGYYAPWYWFPVAWGGYWDPFPSLYCAYYYPFHYGFASFGYYGWCGSTYYSHYSGGHWPRQAWHRRGPQSPYSVASGLKSRRATSVSTSPARPRADAPRVIRGSRSTSTSEALHRSGALRTSTGARSAPAATVRPNGRRTGDASRASQRVESAIGQRRSSRFDAAPVRQTRQATPSTRVQQGRPARGSAVSPLRSSSWSRPSPGRSMSMPRFQPMSRPSAAPRSMAAPPSVSGRLGGGRGR